MHVVTTQRLRLVPLDVDHVDAMLRYRTRNAAYLQPWEPRRPERDASTWRAQLMIWKTESDAQKARHLGVFLDDTTDELIGIVHLTNVVRGVFQACHLGFSLVEKQQGHGYMREALQAVLRIAFDDWDLHRVMANHLPHNTRSAAVLDKLDFVVEGEAKSYLKIDGRWQDHVLRSKVNPAHDG